MSRHPQQIAVGLGDIRDILEGFDLLYFVVGTAFELKFRVYLLMK